MYFSFAIADMRNHCLLFICYLVDLFIYYLDSSLVSFFPFSFLNLFLFIYVWRIVFAFADVRNLCLNITTYEKLTSKQPA